MTSIYTYSNLGGFICSPPLNKQKLCIATRSISSQNLQQRNTPSGSECFPVSIGVCADFLNRRASRYGSKGLEEMLLDRVANE